MVEILEFATHKIIPIWNLTKPPRPGLSVFADGRFILDVQNEFTQSSIMLAKLFVKAELSGHHSGAIPVFRHSTIVGVWSATVP
jgi:hypothetical protein